MNQHRQELTDSLELARSSLAALEAILNARINRSVTVEQRLFNAANGKEALPDAEECRALGLKLGTPDKDGPEIETETATWCRENAQMREVLHAIAETLHVDADSPEAILRAVTHLKERVYLQGMPADLGN